MITQGHGHHGLSIKDSGDKFYGLLTKYMYGNIDKRAPQVEWVLKNVVDKFTKSGKGAKLGMYIDTMDKTDEERVLEDLKYHDRIVLICTDLHYMGAGKVMRPYEEQIASAVALKNKYKGKVLVFMMLDPNRPDLKQLVKKWHLHIDGWKLYPTWYFVTDQRLRWVFDNYPKSVIVHCTDTSPVHWNGSRQELKKKLGGAIREYKWYKSKQWNSQLFSHPRYIKYMADLYQNIAWSAAHLGGKNPERRKYVLNNLGDNFFSDDCFTFVDEDEIIDLASIVTENVNIIHGTDYFMTKVKAIYARQAAIFKRVMPDKLKLKMEDSFNTFLHWTARYYVD